MQIFKKQFSQITKRQNRSENRNIIANLLDNTHTQNIKYIWSLILRSSTKAYNTIKWRIKLFLFAIEKLLVSISPIGVHSWCSYTYAWNVLYDPKAASSSPYSRYFTATCAIDLDYIVLTAEHKSNSQSISLNILYSFPIAIQSHFRAK